MMKCNMDMDDGEDDLKERTQASQAITALILHEVVAYTTQHCTFEALHTNQLEFLL